MIRASCALLAAALLFSSPVRGADPEPTDYIQVEIRGKLDHGIVAIGGETTGTVIHVGKITWELDLGGNAKLLEQAEALNKKTVIVTGRYFQRTGVEIPVRHLVKVESLTAAK
jgi:hypothetical protein